MSENSQNADQQKSEKETPVLSCFYGSAKLDLYSRDKIQISVLFTSQTASKNRSFGKHPRFTFPTGPDNALNEVWTPMEDDLSGH